MDATTGGNAQACALRTVIAAGCCSVLSRDDAHYHPETFISAVTHALGNVHRMCVADDCRKVDS
jgi:hypothetical protein